MNLNSVRAFAAAIAPCLAVDGDELADVLSARVRYAPERWRQDALGGAILAMLDAAHRGQKITVQRVKRIARDAVHALRAQERPVIRKPHRGRRQYACLMPFSNAAPWLQSADDPAASVLIDAERERILAPFNAAEREALEMLASHCYRTRSVRNVRLCTGLSRRHIARLTDQLPAVLDELRGIGDEIAGRLRMLERVATPPSATDADWNPNDER